ncbi:MAG TPA: hypothetical protein VN830_05765 [Verrucomicrobiae bacterium]|nr:hypothetical protein [Verrucomicrobiae bacterium]
MVTKVMRHNLRKMVFAAVLFAWLPLSNGSAYATPQSISNDKELSVALKNAKTSDDHRRIAAYYEEKAKKLQQKEKEEQDLADYFATHPSMYGKIYPTPYQNHKGLADYYHRASGIALQKAKEHRETAESLSPASHGREAEPGRNVRPPANEDQGPQISNAIKPPLWDLEYPQWQQPCGAKLAAS